MDKSSEYKLYISRQRYFILLHFYQKTSNMKTPSTALSMIKFVLWLLDKNTLKNTPFEKYYVLKKHAKFLQQTLSLNMFIPCKDGKPLEEPEEFNSIYKKGKHFQRSSAFDRIAFKNDLADYQQAERSVIFPGWKLKNGESSLAYLESKNNRIVLIQKRTIEQLITQIPDIAITENYYREIIK